MGWRAHAVVPAGEWRPADALDQVVLDHDRRFRRRVALTTQAGHDLLLDLPRATRMRDGDGLVVEGGIVAVIAAAEPVMDIAAPPEALVRLAWHLGNRHLPVQLLPGTLRIGADHVIAAMVRALGGEVRECLAPFEPEAGAYATPAHTHAHEDGHHHSHG